MTLYFAKSVTMKDTGALVTAWAINGYHVRNVGNSANMRINVNVAGYVSPQTLSAGLSPMPGAGANYNLAESNFPAGTDLTTITLAEIYTAISAVADANPNDILNGATLATV